MIEEATPERDAAERWIRQQRRVTEAIASARTPHEVAEAIAVELSNALHGAVTVALAENGAAPVPIASAGRPATGPHGRTVQPLVAAGADMGAIVVLRPERPLDLAERALLESAAGQGAQALTLSRLLAQELTARDEIDALTDTIRRLVELAPQFTAGGTVEEVAGSICDAAREAFEADAAALWVRHGESAIRMIVRRPPTDALPPGVLIDFGRHPGFGDDLESGVPAFIGDVEHAQPELWSEFARGSGSRAQLRLPLATAGRAQAMVVVSWSEPAEAPSREQSALAARFADQAALALAEARRRAAQDDTARLHRRLEHGLLPVIAPHPRIGVVAFYRPGERRMALGGDFYDSVTLDDGRLAMLIGDVSGHGPDAAALGAALRIAWRALLPKCESPDDLFRHLEKVLCSERQRASAFATLAQAVVDPQALRAQVTIAGHPHPILRGRQAAVPALEWGPALGLPPSGEWPTVELELPRRTELVLYTDGLVEGRAGTDSSERFGQPRLLELLDRIPARLDRRRIAGLVDAISAVNGAPLPDDVAVLAATIG